MVKTPKFFGNFDFVVVGSGSAGCAMAYRLAESRRYRVLLLEAGGKDWNPWIHIPVGFGKLLSNRKLTWFYETAPEPALNNRCIESPHGRVLGGSSSTNGLLYVRGQKEDYDGWAAMGNQGWSYQDVLPYFRRAERQTRIEDEWHGNEGPLYVSDQKRNPVADRLIEAAEMAQIRRNDDFNGARQEGLGYYQTTTRKGRRWSAARAYLGLAANVKNLVVATRALASRVRIENGRAVGIEFIRGGVTHYVQAQREVVLCGGAVNSPQLLQLSGIGPADLLQRHGITVLRDATGVGADLQDHMRVSVAHRCLSPITLNDQARGWLRRVLAGAQYALTRTGPLATTAAIAGGFLRSSPEQNSPDLQMLLQMFSAEDRLKDLHTFSGITATICDLHPESRGHVRIRSSDPTEFPELFCNYMGTEGDRRKVVTAYALLRRLMRLPGMEEFVGEELYPGESCVGDEALMQRAREIGNTTFHLSSTCRMGSDPASVVDSRLRVHGVAGLRVADASIMPTVISGNTNAPCIMIGEKGAAMVLEDAL